MLPQQLLFLLLSIGVSGQLVPISATVCTAQVLRAGAVVRLTAALLALLGTGPIAGLTGRLTKIYPGVTEIEYSIPGYHQAATGRTCSTTIITTTTRGLGCFHLQ